MIQNMSHFTCPHCFNRTQIFGTEEDSIARKCAQHDIRLLGKLPLDPRICNDADRGKPTVVAEPDSERAAAFQSIAKDLGSLVGLT